MEEIIENTPPPPTNENDVARSDVEDISDGFNELNEPWENIAKEIETSSASTFRIIPLYFISAIVMQYLNYRYLN